MPKARPLPADPVLAAEIVRRREQIKRAVIKWRKRHPAQARLMFLHCRRFEELRIASKRHRSALQLAGFD